jgi:hypothetical protein
MPLHEIVIADFARTVARARPVGDAAIERHADQRDVETAKVLDVRQPHEGRDAGEARPHHRICEFRIAQGPLHDARVPLRKFTTLRHPLMRPPA